MQRKIDTQILAMKAVGSYDSKIQIAFAKVSQYIDHMFLRAGVPGTFLPLPGSASWTALPGRRHIVVVKAFPWDSRRFPKLAALCPHFTLGGVGVLIRNEVLTAPDLAALWEELPGFLPCPSREILYAVNGSPRKSFQLVLYYLGPGCALDKLPGTDPNAIAQRLRQHGVGDGDEVIRREHDIGFSPGSDPDIDHDRVAGILAEICRRVASAPLEFEEAESLSEG